MSDPSESPAATAADEESDRLSLSDALALGIRLHQQGRAVDAEQVYRAILAVEPEQVDALHFLGLLMHQVHSTEEGIALIQRAVELRPDYVDAHSNLGNLLRTQGRLEEAADAYRRAIERAPQHYDAYNNLGVALKDLGRVEEAEIVLRKAMAGQPERGDVRFNLANVLDHLGKGDEAREQYRKAIELEPMLVSAYDALARTLHKEGRSDEALEVLQQLASKYPDHPVARHMLAALTGEAVPAQASDEYVRQIFDTFADSFDFVLKSLDYRAPELIARALEEFEAPEEKWDILDAGCGTGLCGALLKPRARKLSGVDLSRGMLVKARARNVYDELAEAELTQFLQQHRGAYDLIVVADTLVYFGELSHFFTAAAGALRPGGLLAFTLEEMPGSEGEEAAAPGGGYRIREHGRYEHHHAYVRGVMAAAGFSLHALKREVLRKEKAQPVSGMLIVARAGGGQPV